MSVTRCLPVWFLPSLLKILLQRSPSGFAKVNLHSALIDFRGWSLDTRVCINKCLFSIFIWAFDITDWMDEIFYTVYPNELRLVTSVLYDHVFSIVHK